MTELQAEVAAAADRTGSHATAPALLLQLQAALGRLAGLADAATEGGRLPYRVPTGWDAALGDVAYALYLLGDQTGVDVAVEVRRVAGQVGYSAGLGEAAAGSASADQDPGRRWF